MRAILLFTLLVNALLLTGCGQIGPLYLPHPQPDKSHQHDSFIL